MKHSAGSLEPPAYALGSVDKALRIVHMLRDGTPVRISTVARDLDIGASTAHRILSMLVFHGFAIQDAHRRYLPGPALGAPVLMAQDVDRLQIVAAPVIEELAAAIEETVNLTMRVGPHTRVLMAVGTRGHTELDRSGAVLPAHATAAGRATLALVSAEQLEHLFRGSAAERAGAALDDEGFAELQRELNRTRSRNVALSRNEAVDGLSAVAVPVTTATSRAIALAVVTADYKLDPLLADVERMRHLYRAANELAARLDREPGP